MSSRMRSLPAKVRDRRYALNVFEPGERYKDGLYIIYIYDLERCDRASSLPGTLPPLPKRT